MMSHVRSALCTLSAQTSQEEGINVRKLKNSKGLTVLILYCAARAISLALTLQSVVIVDLKFSAGIGICKKKLNSINLIRLNIYLRSKKPAKDMTK